MGYGVGMTTTQEDQGYHEHMPVTGEDWVEIGLVGFNQGGLDAEVLHGLNQFRLAHKNWVIRDAGHQEFMLHKVLRNPKLAGIIANVTDTKRLEILQKWGKPVVDTSGIMVESPFPSVGVQPGAIGHAGGGYLVKKGFKRIVYVSGMQWTFEMDRWQGLRNFAKESGVKAWWWSLSEERCVDAVNTEDLPVLDEADLRNPFGFLKLFEAPFGVFAAIDRMGVQICDGCRANGLRVPEDVAVLGVDNNGYYCESATPPLSSVRMPGEEMGMVAAKLLDELMQGRKVASFTWLEPKGVKGRASTGDT